MKRYLLMVILLLTGLASAADPVYKNLDAEESAALLAADEPVTVLDVRRAGEFAEGHLKGAKNIDFLQPDFADNLRELDREKPYLVHCAVGGRSTKALAQLRELGFVRVYHLDGGMKAWLAANQPVVKD